MFDLGQKVPLKAFNFNWWSLLTENYFSSKSRGIFGI